ncbi:MAG TPA: FAD-dependent oxidoreductase [Solirubrobacterales bacterium]|nr:FAD-dependent oxidoreductase [Solirubrobacterales bacterium]
MAWNVVIAGGGFGGAMAARELERIMPKQAARLVLVNDVNFMLYTPFLPEAAAGTLEPRHVVTPLREILKRTYLRLGTVSGHDPERRTVELRTRDGETEQLPYDQLLLSLGSVSRVLPIPGLEEHAVGFKSLADAIWLRNHVVETLEAANASDDPARRDELLTYVFVGGGYAGLEALAELQDFAADAMEAYPRARLHGMRWVLVEATGRVLPEIDRGLAEYALRQLRGRGIDIRLETTLEEVTADRARLSSGETLPTRTVVWTAGVSPHPSLRKLSLPLDERGRAPVDDHLRVQGLDAVWAIGDCAAAPDPRGGLCPPTAQHAVRQGPVAARNIAAELEVGTACPSGATSPRSARSGTRSGWARQWGRGIRIPLHSGAVRPRHRDRRQSQGQLLLALAADRHRAAAARPDRRRPAPPREGRTGTPVPHLRQGAEALRPGLPALRGGSIPARPGGGAPSGRALISAARP